MAQPTLICRLCGGEQPEGEFYYRGDSGNRRSECRTCLSEQKKAKYRENPEPRRSGARRYYRANRTARLAANKLYRQTHAVELRLYLAEWHKANPGRNAQYKRDYSRRHAEEERARSRTKNAKARAEHPEETLAYYRAWREQNAEKCRAATRKWSRNNPEAIRQQANLRYARKKGATIGKVSYRAVLLRDEMMCHICGGEIDSLDELHFDHVIPLGRGGAHSMDNLHTAHAWCNQWKHVKLMEELDLVWWRRKQFGEDAA